MKFLILLFWSAAYTSTWLGSDYLDTDQWRQPGASVWEIQDGEVSAGAVFCNAH